MYTKYIARSKRAKWCPILIIILVAMILGSCRDEPEIPRRSGKVLIGTPTKDTISYRDIRIRSTITNPFKLLGSAGHCWKEDEVPTLADTFSEREGNAKEMTIDETIINLNPGVEYQVRAYFRSNWDTIYGEVVKLTTMALSLPTVVTSQVKTITPTSAILEGKVLQNGGFEIMERGVYWGSSPEVVSTGTKLAIGDGIGNFSQHITGLNPGAHYYVQAYAANSLGTGYGDELSFATIVIAPVVITIPVTNKTATTAEVGGSVTSNGGSTVTEHGVFWGISPNVLSTGTKLLIGSGIGTFSKTINGLTPGTAYYVQAYATNSAGTSYGDEIILVTDATTATVETLKVIDKTSTTALVGGVVITDGGASVTDQGFYWGTSPNVVLTGNKLTISTETGTFFQTLSGLTPGTIYYVMAYATNRVGNSFGEELNFTTYQGFIDTRDGKGYMTVTIGTQVWMAENLAYLPAVSPSSIGSDTGKHYYVYEYEGTSVSSAKQQPNYLNYGVLYNWPAAMNGAASSSSVPSRVQGICPDGWHLPSDAEWIFLTDFLTTHGFGYGGIGSDIGKSMASTSGWASSSILEAIGYNQSTNNSSGFRAFPGGHRVFGGGFDNLGFNAFFWSSTEYGSSLAWYHYIYNGSGSVLRSYYARRYGFSVRCLKND